MNSWRTNNRENSPVHFDAYIRAVFLWDLPSACFHLLQLLAATCSSSAYWSIWVSSDRSVAGTRNSYSFSITSCVWSVGFLWVGCVMSWLLSILGKLFRMLWRQSIVSLFLWPKKAISLNLQECRFVRFFLIIAQWWRRLDLSGWCYTQP